MELVRYAGANRLKVELDYRADNGRWGPRVVEPYSLRYTRAGNLLLFVINDYGALRGYRVDHVAGARPTSEAFKPKRLVEFLRAPTQPDECGGDSHVDDGCGVREAFVAIEPGMVSANKRALAAVMALPGVGGVPL